jgi:AcrR family transcriptional regulator
MSPRSEKQFEAIRQKSRKAILKAALRLFASKGYSATTIDDIARRVGISKGLIYNYFPTKEKILESLIDQFAEKVILPQAVTGIAPDPTGYLESLIRAWFREIKSNADLIKLGAQIHTDISLKGLMRKKEVEYQERYTSFFIDIFRRKGSPDPEADAYLLGSIFDGVGLNYHAMRRMYPLARIEDHLIRHYCAPTERDR